VVALGGNTTRTLRFSFNALCRMEQTLGTSVNRIVAGGVAGFTEVRALLWAALLHEQPDLTVEATGDLVQAYLEQGGSFIALSAKMVEALERSGLMGPTPPDGAAPLASGTTSTLPSDAPSASSASAPEPSAS
jgi:hypothetical protein